MSDLKMRLLDMVIAKITKQIENLNRGQKEAMDESAAHKGAMASRYDTFKEEAQYLAKGYGEQLLKVEDLLKNLHRVKYFPPLISTVCVFALVEVEDLNKGLNEKYLLLPGGGGDTFEIDDEEIMILSVDAPLATSFLGKSAGDIVAFQLGKISRSLHILSIT